MDEPKHKMQAEVLATLRASRKPLSAYEVLAQLRPERPTIAPPTVYRTLAALIEGNWIHRLESMNAYVACQCDANHDMAVLSICDDCGVVEETVSADLHDQLANVAGQTGFAPKRHVVEVHGRCAACGYTDD